MLFGKGNVMRTACYDTRNNSQNNIASTSGSIKLQPEDTLNDATTMRLSSYFNSSAATLRMAELTAPSYVEELCKILILDAKL
jgi:hypothetical protein